MFLFFLDIVWNFAILNGCIDGNHRSPSTQGYTLHLDENVHDF